jgi:patatin-related protein
MKEKELRLALVCYGGVSLAVYMHGITKEVQKLLYASRQLHAIRSAEARHSASAHEHLSDDRRELDSDIGYFDLLRQLCPVVDLRVMVDIIAGASAGGINGIYLAQAIARNSPLDPLRTLWLENADVEKLLDEDNASGPLSKFYMRPLVWLFGKWQDRQIADMLGSDATQEMRRKLSRFVRSKWFRPPFSGQRFTHMLYEGMQALERASEASGSLLPPGYPLDLFVTVTDYSGHAQPLRLHSPSIIHEREHRLIIDFHDEGDAPDCRRHIGDAADLSFAARATASFPGAFPAAMLGEMDDVVKRAGQGWPTRARFVRETFAALIRAGSDPEQSAFIDGSVLNNKPFGPAIEALGRRPAHREVDRRIVYIEPNPGGLRLRNPGKAPGFFSSLRASLSDIPRNQPIRDDLDWVQSHSRQVERMNRVVESMSGDVTAAITNALSDMDVANLTPSLLTSWRVTANHAAGRNAGFAYGAYVELKLSRLMESLAAQLAALGMEAGSDRDEDQWRDQLDDWSRASGLVPVGPITGQLSDNMATEQKPWVQWLRKADAHYRVRRLRFIIRALNRSYAQAQGADHRLLDGVKQQLYAILSDMTRRLNPRHAPESLCLAICNAQQPVAALEALTRYYDLVHLDDMADARVSNALMTLHDLTMRRQLVQAYVGFAFFDIATFPMLQSVFLDEYDEIKVDRIAPDDANAIRIGGAASCLRGIRFGAFGAFFSRAYRENDYLWGRLHAADRLVEIIVSSVERIAPLPVNVQAVKRQLFESILASERPHLTLIGDVMDQIVSEVAAMKV